MNSLYQLSGLGVTLRLNDEGTCLLLGLHDPHKSQSKLNVQEHDHRKHCSHHDNTQRTCCTTNLAVSACWNAACGGDGVPSRRCEQTTTAQKPAYQLLCARWLRRNRVKMPNVSEACMQHKHQHPIKQQTRTRDHDRATYDRDIIEDDAELTCALH